MVSDVYSMTHLSQETERSRSSLVEIR